MEKIKTAEQCRNCRQGYTVEGFCAYPDHIELCPLHAAAPDLRAELEDLIESVKSCAKNGTIINGEEKDGVGYLLRLIALYKSLAKAEGK